MMKKIIILITSLLLSIPFSACSLLKDSSNNSVGKNSLNSVEKVENGENDGLGKDKNSGGSSESAERCEVVFDSAGGTYIQSQTVEVGGKIAKPNDPLKQSDSKYEYIFAGWYFGDYQWNFEVDKVSENITLTAKWDVKIYTTPFLPSD